MHHRIHKILRQNTDRLRSSIGALKIFYGPLRTSYVSLHPPLQCWNIGGDPCSLVSFLPQQRPSKYCRYPSPLGISQERHVRRVVGKGLVGGNHRCATAARGRGERAKTDELRAEVCARSRNEAIRGEEFVKVRSTRSKRQNHVDT